METMTLEFPKTSRLSEARVRSVQHVSNIGLVIGAIAIAPLLAFALLWSAVLLSLGVLWMINLF